MRRARSRTWWGILGFGILGTAAVIYGRLMGDRPSALLLLEGGIALLAVATTILAIWVVRRARY
ncbi:MAG: hypothetical protein WCB01_17020 [Candidatus Cybelea sp.]